MNALWRARSAITSATKGWLCVWLLLVLWTMTSLRAKGHASFTDLLSMLLIWVVSTGIVTMASTMPSHRALRLSAWRRYVASQAMAHLSRIGSTRKLRHPRPHPFRQANGRNLRDEPQTLSDICVSNLNDEQRLLHAAIEGNVKTTTRHRIRLNPPLAQTSFWREASGLVEQWGTVVRR